MAFGLTTDGFFPKRQEDIITDLQSDFRDEYGEQTDLDPRRPFGQFIGIFSNRFALLWELAEAVYNSQSPKTAQGVPLVNAVALTNIKPLAATNSTGVITITGTPGTIVLAGFKVHVLGDTSLEFETIANATIGGGGTVDADVQAVEAGSKAALAGTLTEIVNPVSGVTSVTNAADITEGRDRETDSELRERQQEELQQDGPPVEGIRNALRSTTGVTQAIVVVNNTDSVVDGQNPHSVECFVEGGDAADIAQTLFNTVGGGIETVGDITENVTDSQGFTQVMKFSRPTPVEITITVNITPNLDAAEDELYPVDGDDQVTEAVLEYANELTIGKDVFFNKMYSFINAVPGVIGISITGNKAGGPTVSDKIEIDASEIADFDSARITVNS